ncbi:hypothetical protein LUZ60_016015 [Juncus effusus]|nr:hypothetical protein LUZ60_016015 [Juncus effusus]
MGSMKLYPFFIWFIMADLAASSVVLMGNNVTLTFDDVEANFAPTIKGSGVCGTIYVSDPLDACDSLTNKAPTGQISAFALIIRGNCTFDDKIRNTQNAGYKAAIVFDNEDNNPLVSMAGSSTGIHIYAVFISKSAGQTLTRYANRTDIDTWLIPTFENSAWSLIAISFISLLAMSAVLATCFFVRRHRVRRERPVGGEREVGGMGSERVREMPSVVFSLDGEGKEKEMYCTGFTCAICLEDYCVGDRLRVLPCRHKFHAICVDMWLTSWRTFCPVCKRDARANSSFHTPPPSETTPLLSSSRSNSLHSVLSISNLSSSPSVRISSLPPRSQSRIYTSPQIPNNNNNNNLNNNDNRRLFSSFNNDNNRRNSPPISISRSYADFRAMSSFHSYRVPHTMTSSSPHHRYNSPFMTSSSPHHQYNSPLMTSSSPNHQYGSHLTASSSPYRYGSYMMTSSLPQHQYGMTSSSPYRYGSPYNVHGSSVESRQSYLRHCNESGASLSELDSAQSLPGC